MKNNYVFSLKILFFAFVVLTRDLFGEECNSSGINCISCTSYQKCDAGNPVGPILKGNECDQDKLELCHAKYNCYGLNECTQAGVFPDAEDESSYYVCLNDPTAFLKYEFRCVEGEFFDKTTLMCIPKAATLTDSEVSSSLVDSTVETESSSEASSTSSTESSSEASSTSSTESSSEASSSTSSTESSSEASSTSSTESSSEASSSTSSTESSSEASSTSSTESSSEASSSTSSTESSSEASSTSSTESSSEASSTTSAESSSTTTTSSTEITTSTPGTIPTSASPFVCTAAGIFPNPSNCKIYHRCSTSLKLFNYVCPGSSYFNENLLKCSMIITPSCQAQILQNSSSNPITSATTSPTPTTKATTTSSSTTTTPTTTTITTTTTTTPSTTTTTTTTTPTTSTPFSCPMSGTFSNPNSCKTYYRCSTSGKSFVYTCPGETYFNEFTKRCSLQITPRCQKLLQS